MNSYENVRYKKSPKRQFYIVPWSFFSASVPTPRVPINTSTDILGQAPVCGRLLLPVHIQFKLPVWTSNLNYFYRVRDRSAFFLDKSSADFNRFLHEIWPIQLKKIKFSNFRRLLSGSISGYFKKPIFSGDLADLSDVFFFLIGH